MSKIILVYHSIGTIDPFIQVSWDSFLQQINYVIRIMRPARIADFLNSDFDQDRCLIMFDDAFKDALPAMKYLDENAIPFSVAVVDNYLKSINHCTLDDLLSLNHADFVFHTVSHNSLDEFNDADLVKELVPHNSLHLPLTPSVIVYPRGVYNRRILECVKQKGYKWGLTCLPFHLSKKYYAHSLEIPRININGYLPFWKYKMFLTPMGNTYLHAAYLKRKMLGEDYLAK